MNTLENESTAHTYASAFGRMAWAFLFLGVYLGPTITTGSERFFIDLLPDFVGYLLIAAAANRLVGLHAGFRSVRNLALLLAFLALPLAIQCQIITIKSGNLTYWTAPLPLWPFLILVPVLDLVLVWKVCGLTADVARHANEGNTAHSALARRNLYIGIKILTVGGAVYALAVGAAGLILPLVIIGVILGILIVCLMMGLMSQARRICLTTPHLPDIEARLGIQGRSTAGTRTFRVLMAWAILLPLLLFVGVVYYWVDWQNAREELRTRGNADGFLKVATAFFEDIKADRLDAAYQLTSTGFKKRMSKEQLTELVQRYPAVRCGPGTERIGWGKSSGPDSSSESYVVKDAQGKHFEIVVVVRREDNIFFRRPPPPQVDEFKVNEVAPHAPRHPLGRDFPPRK